MTLNYDENTYHKQLVEVSREQLLKYPNISIKQRVKNIVKSMIRRNLSIKTDRYFWPNGLLAVSLEYSHKLTNDKKDVKQLEKYYDNWIRSGMVMSNSDYAINGYSLIYLYKIKNRKKYLKAIDQIAEYVLSQETAEDGSIPYRKNNGDRIYVDLLGLTCPFLSRYADLKQSEEVLNLCVLQLKNFLSKGMDPVSGLPYHAYDANQKTKLGIIGWGRGVGWLLIGLVDTLEYIPKKHKDYQYLKNQLEKLVLKVMEYQHESGGYSWQLTAREGLYDSSSTSMISYAIRKGINIGLLPDKYTRYVDKDIESLYKITEKGLVLESSGECRGLSMYPQIYENNPWSQGPTTSLVANSIMSDEIN